MKFLLPIITSFLLLTGCSSKSDKDYMKEAAENTKKNNIPEVISAYENLVKEHPESKLAPEALFQLAQLYQNLMVKNLSETETLENAVKTYKRIFDKYPGYSKAPDALFISGFILANDLKKYKEATETYRLFLEKYPDNKKWGPSAKYELENMGIPPEVILENKPKVSSDGRGF